jgi:arsenate reductase
MGKRLNTMSLTIYHNPRCSKSRKTLAIIRSKGLEPTIVEYLKSPPDAATLRNLATMLDVPLADMLRRGEEDFREAGNAVPLDDEVALAEWVRRHPIVLQRPIVVNEDSGEAVMGRPPENVLEIL